MATVDEDEYRRSLWPPLEKAVKMLLVQKPGVYLKISYEEMYRYVYTSVCHQHSAVVYADLLKLLSSHLTSFTEELEDGQSLQWLPFVREYSPGEKLNGGRFVEEFDSGLRRYTQAIGCIVPIFAYLNRTYLSLYLKLDLKEELNKMLDTMLIDRYVPRVLDQLSSIQDQPFGCDPTIVAHLINRIYELRPAYARIHPHLFARHIPNILPPTRADEIPMYIEEAQKVQQELSTIGDFRRCDMGRKRGLDDAPMAKR